MERLACAATPLWTAAAASVSRRRASTRPGYEPEPSGSARTIPRSKDSPGTKVPERSRSVPLLNDSWTRSVVEQSYTTRVMASRLVNRNVASNATKISSPKTLLVQKATNMWWSLLVFLLVTTISTATDVTAGDMVPAKVAEVEAPASSLEVAVGAETPRRPARAPAAVASPDPASAHAAGSPPRLELSTEFFLVPDRVTPAAPSHPAVVVVTRRPGSAPGDVALLPAGGMGAGSNRSLIRPPVRTIAGAKGGGFLRREAWVIPLLVFSTLCMVAIAGFEVFVLCKARRTTPSRRHLFLGQMLLLGLFLCAGVGGVLAASPTPATCGAVRFGAGVALALVFGALLVKCVFLISLNGGVYLPAPYQALLLLFAVLIQVAVGLQWLLNAPPQVDFLPLEETLPSRRLVLTAEDLAPLPVCRAPYTDVLLSLLYVACLIAFVCVLAVKSRGIRDNYREATFIGLAVGCVVPIWLVWVLSGLLVGERHRDACLAFGLVATATVVFLVMFMPKGRQLAAMGKEGVYVEDREERFSTLSRGGSGYSPSFYHFKPIKYSAAPLGAPQIAQMTAASHKQPAPAVTTIADRVALVAAPSYTRMYHYYPYCYYPGGVYVKPDDGNVYTTLEPTLSSNPNVFFQRSGVHPGMMY